MALRCPKCRFPVETRLILILTVDCSWSEKVQEYYTTGLQISVTPDFIGWHCPRCGSSGEVVGNVDKASLTINDLRWSPHENLSLEL